MNRGVTTAMVAVIAMASSAIPSRCGANGAAMAAGLPGRWSCWAEADDALPCREGLNAVAVSDAGDVWAVGEGGLILRRAGGAWQRLESPVGKPLYAVAMAGRDEGWAVGLGAALRWDGRRWTAVDRPRPELALRDLAISASGDGWAVGDGGLVLRWDGEHWREYSDPTLVGVELRGLSFLTPNEGWAVGLAGGTAVIARFDGLRWKSQRLAWGWRLRAVSMISPSNGWAVGLQDAPFGDSASLILHWDGEAWHPYPGFAPALSFDVAMASPTLGWIVGPTGTLHWDGQSWSKAPNATSLELAAVAAAPGGEAWAVTSEQGSVVHFDGQRWRVSLGPSRAYRVRAATFLTPTDGWAVGDTVLHWDGATWRVPAGEIVGTMKDVAMVSAEDGWAVGQDHILRWDGHQWTNFDDAGPGVNRDLLALDLVSPDDGWAVGSLGYDSLVLRLRRGSWTRYPTPTTWHFSDVDMLTPTDGWAIGQTKEPYGPLLARWDGQAWHRVEGQPLARPRQVAMISAEDGWILEYDGTLLRWDGTRWSRASAPPGMRASVIAARATDDLWAAGLNAVAHWDGRAWLPVPVLAQGYDITVLAVTSATDGWAFPGDARLLRWTGPRLPWALWLPQLTRR